MIKKVTIFFLIIFLAGELYAQQSSSKKVYPNTKNKQSAKDQVKKIASADEGYIIGGSTPLTAENANVIMCTDGISIYGVKNNKTELLPAGCYCYNGKKWVIKQDKIE